MKGQKSPNACFLYEEKEPRADKLISIHQAYSHYRRMVETATYLNLGVSIEKSLAF